MAEHHMVSMKLSKAEAKESNDIAGPDRPEYPYGLSIHLDNEALSRLGIDKLPEVGMKLRLNAEVLVKDISENSRIDEKETMRSVGLQITDMELLSNPKGGSTSDELYGGA
jgi:hypothetical protein